MPLLSHGELLIVETDDAQLHLGTVDITPEGLVVRTGFVGHPTVLDPEHVERIYPVSEHPDLDALQQAHRTAD